MLAGIDRLIAGVYICGEHHEFGTGYCRFILERSIPFTWLPDIPQQKLEILVRESRRVHDPGTVR